MIIWAWPWRPMCRCPWSRPACPRRLMMCVMSIRVSARGPWTTSLWPIVGKFHSRKLRTRCSVQRSGAFVLFCIPLCQGVSVLMIGCFAIGGCRVTSIATPCSARRSHQPEAIRWRRSSRLTLGGAEASLCQVRARPMMLLVSSLLGRESRRRLSLIMQRR